VFSMTLAASATSIEEARVEASLDDQPINRRATRSRVSASFAGDDL